MGHPWLDKQEKAAKTDVDATIAPSRVRATFRALPDFAPGANVWVLDGRASEPPTATLLYDYPDLKPAPGWRIDIMDVTYEVSIVTGLTLGIVKL